MTDNLYTKEEAREKLMVGVRKIAGAVGKTMGTAGKNSLIEALERPGFYATNDGATILQTIRLADPIEEMGRKILSEAVSRANRASGDGSSTTAVLTAAILEEGMKHLDEESPMAIKRSLETCIPLIEEYINTNKKLITTDTVGAVASISAEDEGIGAMIQEIYQKIGNEGVISWDVSKTPEDFYTIGTGIMIDGAKYVSNSMADIDTQRGLLKTATLKNSYILLTKQKLTSTGDIDRLGEQLYAKGIKELIVFCNEIDPIIVNQLIEIRVKTSFRIIVVKMPTIFGDEWWEDLALATGATTIGEGIKLKNATIDQLGTCENIKITDEDTYLDGIKDLTTHILALKVDGSDESLNRTQRLNTKTARYFVGAHSESALAYRRLKVEDAINAASCALDNGVVAGGGVALYEASKDLSDTEIGGMILKEALKAPMAWIAGNSGQKEIVSKELKEGWGFNSKTAKYENMFESGIVDPTDVVISAMKNAIGVAASILTVGTVVLLPREEWQPKNV